MTLRVTLEIIPFGKEDEAYTIETLNISNTGIAKLVDPLLYEYVIEHNEYKKYDKHTPRVNHNRQEGPLVLVKKALEVLLEE